MKVILLDLSFLSSFFGCGTSFEVFVHAEMRLHPLGGFRKFVGIVYCGPLQSVIGSEAFRLIDLNIVPFIEVLADCLAVTLFQLGIFSKAAS